MEKTLSIAISEIEKRFGKGSVIDLNSTKGIDGIERIKSGSMSLDQALGGGWPKGRIVEIYGPESSGKSTLALHAIAECQKEGGVAAYVDAEFAFDRFYAENLGVDVSSDNFIFCQPDFGEQALEMAENLIKTGKISVLVIDSVAALVPKSELDGEMGEAKMGLQARLMSQGLRKITGIVSKSNTCVIFINQLREKIGVMFGSPETTTGGNALKFYASIRCDVRRIGQEKDGDEVKANKTRVKVVKNKTFPPFRQCEFNILFGEGIDSINELIDLCAAQEIIKKSGSWFTYGEVKLGQGAENVKKLLLENPELTEELSDKLRKKLNIA